MTSEQFRRMALSFPGVEERSHMEHPDFRVGGKVFATLGCPDEGYGMVKLTTEQQRIFVQAHPDVFSLAAGAWGVQGNTVMWLRAADESIVRETMTAAWLGRAPKTLVKRFSPG